MPYLNLLQKKNNKENSVFLGKEWQCEANQHD